MYMFQTTFKQINYTDMALFPLDFIIQCTIYFILKKLKYFKRSGERRNDWQLQHRFAMGLSCYNTLLDQRSLKEHAWHVIPLVQETTCALRKQQS
jgi:hypothetical protein